MKTTLRSLSVLALAGLPLTAGAVPYTDIYDIVQAGFDGGDFPGVIHATIRITDEDRNGLISASDPVVGSFVFTRPIGNGRTYVRGFEVTGIFGSSLLAGSFSISALSHLGGPAVITNTGGSVVNMNYPFTGGYTLATTTQAPTVTRRVPEGGGVTAVACTTFIILLGMSRKHPFRRLT